MKHIYVKWVDSASGHTEWTRMADVKDDAYFCETVGFLVNESKKQLHIANSVYGEETHCCMVMTIPKVAIIKRRYLK